MIYQGEKMSQKISLKEAERKAFRLTSQDGLWDIFISCLPLQFAIGPLLSPIMGDFWSSVIFLPVWGLAYLAIWLVRKYVVKPRIGMVKYGPVRRLRLMRFTSIMLVGNLAILALGIVVYVNFATLSGVLIAVILGLFWLIGFSMAAYFLDYPRLYFYGLLLAVSPLIGEWLYSTYGVAHHGFPVTFGFSAGVMIVSGIATFIHFLHDNPLPTMEDPLEEISSNV
jgi:hypothetical protein